MINNTYLVGISGVAGAGKDTLYKLLARRISELGLSVKNFALGDVLKAEARDGIQNSLGIDILNCTRDEKDKAREYLYNFSADKRLKTKGQYFTKKVEDKIKMESNLNVAFVTDIRFAQYEKDEVFWLKNLHADLIHVSQYQYVEGQKVWLQPFNEQEKVNDPIVKELSTFKIDWEKLPEHKIEEEYGVSLDLIATIIYGEAKRII